MSDSVPDELRQLAQLYNVQTAYYDVTHHLQQASTESLLAILQALGAPLISLNDVTSALRERRQASWQQTMEPVIVVWGKRKPIIKVRLPAKLAVSAFNGCVELDSGEKQTFKWSADDLGIVKSEDVEGTSYIVRRIVLPESLPWGYHKFSLDMGPHSTKTIIISAPVKSYLPSEDNYYRNWGVFSPLYALHSQNGPGSGDYTTLGSLVDWISDLGGKMVATLPILPTFLDKPFDPSPYAPVSRLLWNEFYIDLSLVPELSESPDAKALLQSSSFLSEINELRDSPLVDYHRLMALKRSVLEQCCRHLITEKSGRLHEFQNFIQAHPIVEDYARFRAAMEKQGSTWPSWPERLRDGSLNESDYEEQSKLYHAYSQWLAHEQVHTLERNAQEKGMTLYFDLPVGVHSEGYDTWRESKNFALDATVGAPPDTVFTNGQNWGFPPLHPEKIREQEYRYFTTYIRHHLRHAGMLRIDHVMGLHRLLWIPKGLDAGHGVYVRYRADEFYAILSLESQRHQSIIVGEDLGTVPAHVRPTMARHGLQRMYVLHYELAGDSSDALPQPKRNIVASLNTHDMPPFAAFWQEKDIPERLRIGLLNEKSAQDEKQSRQAVKHILLTYFRENGWLDVKDTDVRAVMNACQSFMSASPARFVLVNLEDLWLEMKSQNIPGTSDSNPNWRRKARYSIEEFCQIPEVHDTLKKINKIRKQTEK